MANRSARTADLVTGDARDELAALIALLRAQLVTPYHLSVLVEELGSAVDLAQLSEEDRLFIPAQPSHSFVGAITDEDTEAALIDVARWTGRSYDIRTVLDDSYPGALRTIFNHPPLLFVDGHWDEERYEKSIAIVGTRRPSAQGLRRSARLSRELVKEGFVVFSGMATGIDAAAHEAAIDAGGTTVAVMGTGINRRFPAENATLANAIIASGGALISQFFPDQPGQRWTFPNRNVVMSGLTMATVVVEAGMTSGARMQARVALQHGRTVFLLQSLVDQHGWAREYVENGAYGTKAIVISSTHDILERVRFGDQELLSA